MQKLIEKLIITINYSGIFDSDIEEIVKATRYDFKKEGFFISEGFHKNINGQLNDPEVFEVSASSKNDVIKKYVFEKEGISINITNSSIDIVVDAAIEYKGFEIYKKYVLRIINEMITKFNKLFVIERMGIRKINSLFIRDIQYIDKYFLPSVFVCKKMNLLVSNDKGDILLSESRITISDNCYKVNVITETQIGDAQENIDGIGSIFKVYRLILDIDAYWDQELEMFVDFERKLEELNKKVTNIYISCLNADFQARMKNDSAHEDQNIFGGIK